MSTKRDELDRILDHMNIQVRFPLISGRFRRLMTCVTGQMDNPINVLSQDAARNFLVFSDAKQKYEVQSLSLLFFWATRGLT